MVSLKKNAGLDHTFVWSSPAFFLGQCQLSRKRPAFNLQLGHHSFYPNPYNADIKKHV